MTKGRQTKERIFSVATKEFAQYGYAGARVARIAAKAGVNKERIYAYFGSKEGMFVKVWKHTYGLIIEADESFLALGDEDIPRLGEIVLRRYMTFHEEHEEFWKILAWENLQNGKHAHLIRGLKGPVHDHLKRLYYRGQERGFYAESVSFETFIFVLISVSFFFASNRATMSETLQRDYLDVHVRQSFIDECSQMLFPWLSRREA